MREGDLVRLLGAGVVSIIAALSLVLPMVLAANWLLWRRRQFERANTDPFTDLPLRPPGESLRLKIDDLSSELALQLIVFFAPALVGAIFVSQAPIGRLLSTWAIGFAICTVWSGVFIPRILKKARTIWDYRLGFMGERVVGEALNQLAADGFRIFHDLPFDGFNLDHVVVGPPGVFVFETKARRKTRKETGQKEYRVSYDGEKLRWPDGTCDSFGIEQAIRNAKTLSGFLGTAAAVKVWVKPVLVLPGWMIDRKAVGAVNVLNPKEIRASFPRAVELNPEEIQRISHQLSEKCRLALPARE
jgi:hypothetical protein